MPLTVSNKTIIPHTKSTDPEPHAIQTPNALKCTTQPKLLTCIDKLSLTLTGFTADEKTEMVARALAFKDHGFADQKYLRNGYAINLRLLPKLVHSSAIVSLHPKTETRPYLRIEFNPSAMGADAILELFQGELSVLLCNGLSDLKEKGKVSRIDYAVDIVGAELENLRFASKYAVRSMKYDRHGRMETLYLGNPKSPKQTRIYDKVAQLKSGPYNMLSPHEPVTRVERIVRNGGLLRNINNMKNPLANLVVSTMNDDHGAIPVHYWRMFRSYERENTTQVALAILPISDRQNFMNVIQKGQPSWWNSNTIWSEWPVLVKSLGLTNFGNAA